MNTSDVYKRAFEQAHAEYNRVKARLAELQEEKRNIELELSQLDRAIKALECMLKTEDKHNVQS